MHGEYDCMCPFEGKNGCSIAKRICTVLRYDSAGLRDHKLTDMPIMVPTSM